jgi:hypothetical protein
MCRTVIYMGERLGLGVDPEPLEKEKYADHGKKLT